MTQSLFASEERFTQIAPGAALLEGFALADETEILSAIEGIVNISPFRKMLTPRGFEMSVAMTNCGDVGWVSDRSGYRYERDDPQTHKPWPDMSDRFLLLAQDAASKAGYDNFVPDVCLINRYEVGTKLGLHQDKDESDLDAPIVSVSLGLPATFLFGGLNRQDKTQKISLHHGDVLVFGGESRLAYHGIAPIKDGNHSLLGNKRINLTFRKAT